MGMPKGSIQGFLSDPCLQGTLAFISSNPSKISKDNIQNTMLGCVRGKSCDVGKIAIYDTSSSSILCKSL
jgi:hypothetical protein